MTPTARLVQLLCVQLIIVSSAPAFARTVPASDEGFTMATLGQAQREHLERLLLRPLVQRSELGAIEREAIASYLDTALPILLNTRRSGEDIDHLLEVTSELTKAHPRVREFVEFQFLDAWRSDVSRRDRNAEELARAFMARWRDHSHPAVLRAKLCMYAAREVAPYRESSLYAGLGARAFIEAIERGEYHGREMRVLMADILELFGDPTPREDMLHFVEELERNPIVSEWVALTARGYYELREALHIEATTSASNRGEHAAVLSQHIDGARAALTAAHELEPAHPEAAAMLIEVGRLDDAPLEYIRGSFEAAVAAQIDWPPAHEYYIEAITPKHAGSIEDLVEYGRRCAATERYDTAVPYQLFRAVRKVHAYRRDFSIVEEERLFPLLDAMYSAYAEVESPPIPHEELATQNAMIAGAVGAFARASELDLALGDQFRHSYLDYLDINRDQFQHMVIMGLSGVADQVRRAEALIEAGRLDEGIDALEAARRAADADERVQRLLAGRIASAETVQRLGAGETVTFAFDDAFTGWHPVATWHRNDDGSIKGVEQHGSFRGDTAEPAKLLFMRPIGRRYEYSGRFRFGADTPQRNVSAAILIWGSDPLGRVRNATSLVFTDEGENRRPRGDRLWVRAIYGGTFECEIEVEREGWQTFAIKVWDDRCAVSLNGERIFECAQPTYRAAAPGEWIGLYSNEHRPEANADFADLTARLLGDDESPF